MPELRIPLSKSLSFRQAKHTVIVAFSIGLILSSAQIYFDYSSLQNDVQQTVSKTLKIAYSTAFLAAYNLDESAAKQITRGLLSNQPIIEAVIYDNFGNILGSARRDSIAKPAMAWRWLFGDPKTISNTLYSKDEYSQPVGELTIVVDSSLTAESFIKRSMLVFVSGVLRNFVLALSLILVFYFTITRSLLLASSAIRQGDPAKKIPLLKSHEDDEIGVLIKEFNGHLEIIEDQHKQIVDTNINLESLVALRTQQLDDKNRELEKERQSVLRASEAKSDFLAMMSHEIRTPMHGILGLAELLERDCTTPKQREYTTAILDSGNSLLTLMNTVLDYSRYEQTAQEFERITFNPHRLISSIIFLMTASAEKKQLLLTLNVDPLLPKCLLGDPGKLRQVLINLLSNAIKFTHRGCVELCVKLLEQSSDKGSVRVLFSIKDSGPGISKESQRYLFKPFSQADSSIGRRFGGSGMGLAICKQIVDQQGGEIGFTSEDGKGSVFHFELVFPIAKELAEVHKENSDSNVSLQKLNVLVVDDVEINQKLTKGQLESEGHQVFVAGNGKEALDCLERESIDVILMDLYMPVMDGLETTRRIRGMDSPGWSDIPIIGVTANISRHSHDECISSGMNLVISKPVDYDKLQRSLSQVMDISHVQIWEDEDIQDDEFLNFSLIEQHEKGVGLDKAQSLYVEAREAAVQRVESMQQSEMDNYMEIKDNAHALAGLCANFGFPLLGKAAEEIENMVNTDINREDVAEKIEMMRTVLYKTFNKLEERALNQANEAG